ncbi:LuxR C-terminal-related transcriptional regulator [Streptomyces tubercidicus]|uniref:LuxR C-terminal-related transcriptional regulator n=1 Tax=Streptomyces tubercidicus TaxID=47759 RepID=UPI003464ED57
MHKDHQGGGRRSHANQAGGASSAAGPGRKAGNLPTEVTTFVGRRWEVSEARRLLARTRLLTLTGAGGLGKTRLALRIAAEVRRSFPKGAWVVDLAPLNDGAFLARTVLTALGLDHDSARPALPVLSDHLADKRLLLVLDNCEHLLDSCAELTRSLLAAAPHLQVLATSRQALGVDGEHLLTVRPLSTPDPHRPPAAALTQYEAVRLFIDRAAAVVPGFTVGDDQGAAVAGICHRLDGIPLAIELAAARLRVLSPQQILERLDDRFALLSRGSSAAPARQRTLRAAIDGSFELCTPSERRLWARLSVFCGGFDLEAAEEVCTGDGLSRAEILDVVTGLVDKSILLREDHHDQVRLRMLETIRQYGRSLLDDGRGSEERESAQRRHRDHYQRLAARAESEWLSPRQLAWFARLRLEHANIRAALEFCLSTPGEAAGALHLITSLWGHRPPAGGLEEVRHWLGRALAQAPEPSPVRAKALWIDGWLAYFRGDTAAGQARLAECQNLAETLGDAESLAHAVRFAGLAAVFHDDCPRAVPLLEDALERHRAQQDLAAQWQTLFLLSLACCLSDDPRATELGEECLALCNTHDAQWSRSHALWVLGLQQWLCGDTQRAITLLQDALRVEQPAHNLLAGAQCLEVLAWATAHTGRSHQAAKLLGAAQTLWQSAGCPLAGLGRLMHHHNSCRTQLQGALGDESFATAVQAGAELTFEEAVACALGRPLPPTSASAEENTPTPLTRREKEVVDLLAQGLTNKEIATKLVISPRTAGTHVNNILAKLGFTSRTQIATWAVEQRAPNRQGPERHR